MKVERKMLYQHLIITSSKSVKRFQMHGIKGFVIPTKSFVTIGTTKVFCYNNKMISSIKKTFGCCFKIFGCSYKKNICCPYFCCRNKTIFFRVPLKPS